MKLRFEHTLFALVCLVAIVALTAIFITPQDGLKLNEHNVFGSASYVSMKGWLDKWSADNVQGWAYDPADSERPVNIYVKKGSITVATGVTSFVREDVNEVFGITGKHGFNIDLRGKLPAGKYYLTVYAENKMLKRFGVDVTASLKNVNNAEFVNINTTKEITPSAKAAAYITMRNTGTTTWTAAEKYRLGAVGDSELWGSTRVYLAEEDRVAPGETYTFEVPFTTPQITGIHPFKWRMVQEMVEWFGEEASTDIKVVDAAKPFDSVFVSQEVPDSMIPGTAHDVKITFRNTGTETWSSADKIRLSAPNYAKNWGVSRIDIAKGQKVHPGEEYTFTFDITAPATPGDFKWVWRLLQAKGVGWFGEEAPRLNIEVIGELVNDAEIMAIHLPPKMEPNHPYTIGINVKNTGTTTWTREGIYKVGIPSVSKSVWGTVRLELGAGESVAPGESHMFLLEFTSPNTAGPVALQVQMVQEMVEWFGEPSMVAQSTVSGIVKTQSVDVWKYLSGAPDRSVCFPDKEICQQSILDGNLINIVRDDGLHITLMKDESWGNIGVVKDGTVDGTRCFSGKSGDCSYKPGIPNMPISAILPILPAAAITPQRATTGAPYHVEIESFHWNPIDTSCNVHNSADTIEVSSKTFLIDEYDFGGNVGKQTNVLVTELPQGYPSGSTNPNNAIRFERYFYVQGIGPVMEEGWEDPDCRDSTSLQTCNGEYTRRGPGQAYWNTYGAPITTDIPCDIFS